MADIQDALKAVGVSQETVQSIKLGRGVVGKTTYAAVAAFSLLAVVATRLEPSLLLWLAGLGVLVFVVYFVGVLAFAHRNPGTALLEGGELLVWQHTELAAKGSHPIAGHELPPVQPMVTLPPKADA